MSQLDPKIRIRAPLRCEGIGRLDCAEDTESGMRMAVRWLPLEANGEVAAKAVSELPEHPTLPRIRQTGRVGSAAYVAMDFPDGRLLSTEMGAPLPDEELRRLGAEIASALASIHAQGAHHGELSADSVLRLPSEKAVLWDMPLVIANRLTDRRGEERNLAQLVRVAPFLSPERAQGMPPSAASDVYGLGAVLCLAAGAQPPRGATTLAVIHQIATHRWSPELPESLPGVTRELLARMVHKNPLARPSAREAAELLLRPSPRLPAAVETSPSLEPEAKTEEPELIAPVWRRPFALVGGLAVLVAALAAAAFYLTAGAPAAVAPPAPAEVTPAPVAPAARRAPTAEPAPAEELDLVAPLIPTPRQERQPITQTAVRRAGKKAKAEGPKLKPAEKAELNPPDFSFLEPGGAPPRSELKRPEF